MLNSEPPDELLLEDELLELDELELELEELEEELPVDGLVLPPPQAANAAVSVVTPHAKKILFMVIFHINMMRDLLDIEKTISPSKTLFDGGDVSRSPLPSTDHWSLERGLSLQSLLHT